LGYLLYRIRNLQNKWRNQDRRIFAVLAIATPATSFFVGLLLNEAGLLSLPGMTIELFGMALMLFSALPWVLAAGLLGPIAAACLAGLSGIILGFWSTHTYFTPFELVFTAIIFSLAMQQNYRTFWFKWLRHPLVAALGLSLVYPLIFIANTLFVIDGMLAVKLDYAFMHVRTSSLLFAVPLVIAGIVGEILMAFFEKSWGGQPPWKPSPAERNLEARFYFFLMPLLAILLLIFVAGDWLVAGNAAERMLRQRMESAAEVAADGVSCLIIIAMHLPDILKLIFRQCFQARKNNWVLISRLMAFRSKFM